jgi:hypothetical protein
MSQKPPATSVARRLFGADDSLARFASLRSDQRCIGIFLADLLKPAQVRKSTLELLRAALVRQMATVDAMLREEGQ